MVASTTRYLYLDWELGHWYSAVLPVGRGLAVVMISPSGHLLLYDCGSDGVTNPCKFITAHLKKHLALTHSFARTGTPYEITQLILSHPHVDHFSALPYFYGDHRRVKVRTLKRRAKLIEDAHNEMQEKKRRGEAREGDVKLAKLLMQMSDEYCHPAQSVDWGFDLTCFEVGHSELNRSWGDDPQQRYNNSSIVAVLSQDDMKWVLSGDLESEGWDLLLDNERFVRRAGGASHFLASHHGHDSGWNPAIVSSLGKPDVWLISTRGGDPHSSDSYSEEAYSTGILLDDGTFRRSLSTKRGHVIEILKRGNKVQHRLSTIDIAMTDDQQRLFARRLRQLTRGN